jgi:rhamnosyltransferase
MNPFVQIVGAYVYLVNSPEHIVTVLVLYEMSLEESPAYQSLGRALEKTGEQGNLFVYDNSKVSGIIPSQNQWKIQYQHDPSNPGVSKAYNQAYEWAKSHGKKWLLLADQDTTFPMDAFAQYRVSLAAFPQCLIFAPTLVDQKGLLSPFRRRVASGRRLNHVAPGLHPLTQLQAVNSGLMVSTALFGAAGGYDERLRLDFSDFEFFRRIAKQTSHLAVVNVSCEHQHSSSRSANLDAAITRFRSYLHGSGIMAKTEGVLAYRARAFLHAARLSIQHRSAVFIETLLSDGP